MGSKLVSFFIFACLWIGLTGFGRDEAQIASVAISALFIVIFAAKLKLLPMKNAFNVNAVFYCGWLAKEILLSALAVSKIAWRRHIILQPSLGSIKTIQTNDVGITVYANSITLTPGTVTLSVEGNNLLVHALDDAFISGLQEEEMDNRIKRIIKNPSS